jgi:hypothetical protein
MTGCARHGKQEKPETESVSGKPTRNEVSDETGGGYVPARFGTVPVLITRKLAAQIQAFREKFS